MNKQGKFKEIIRKSLAEQVAERLKEALLNGEFPPSRRIPEERLAAAFQISRTPLRQAMQHLERVGLLERHPSGGMQPATITLQDVTDAVALRAHTEGLLARRAAQNASSISSTISPTMHRPMMKFLLCRHFFKMVLKRKPLSLPLYFNRMRGSMTEYSTSTTKLQMTTIIARYSTRP